jgi:signal transduction histidine kinase
MLHNVVKHAEATEAYLYLEEADGLLTLSVWDNGKGFDVPASLADLATCGYLGLASLEQRARRLGGRLELHSEKGCETQVTIAIPLGGARTWA